MSAINLYLTLGGEIRFFITSFLSPARVYSFYFFIYYVAEILLT